MDSSSGIANDKLLNERDISEKGYRCIREMMDVSERGGEYPKGDRDVAEMG